MQIELIGCTGAGKSGLLKAILKDCRAQGVDALTGDDFVLKQFHLDWIKVSIIRTFLIDLISIFICVLSFRRYSGFYNLLFKIIRQIPSTESRLNRINIARNSFKKVAIYDIVCRKKRENTIVFIDEGTIHSVHNFFVHISGKPPLEYFPDFIKVVPVPDYIMYLEQDKDILIERTVKRGHKRISQASQKNVQLFIEQAIDIFNRVEKTSILSGKLIKINSNGKVENKTQEKDSFYVNLIIKSIVNRSDSTIVNKAEPII